MEAVAVYSDADAAAQHVRLADRAIRIGPAPPAESYLRIDAILDAALETGAEAIHPGYGFLAERAAFARAVEAAGIVFVGPPSATIDALGDKLHARRTAREVGVTAVPGTLEPAPVDRPDQVDAIVAEAEAIGFPLLVKAAAGGGGRGMRRVATAAELPAALASGSHEAASAFGDGSVYLEREIVPARHIEVQLLGDDTGRVVAIGERDCSLQRRHQKLVEEAPAPGLTRDERRTLHELAVRVATAAGLRNAATAEFLLRPRRVVLLPRGQHAPPGRARGDRAGVGARHRPRAALAGRRAAAVGATPSRPPRRAAEPGRPRHRGPDRGRGPGPRLHARRPGRIRHWVMPAGPGVRVDTGVEAGDRVPPEYDNLDRQDHGPRRRSPSGDRPAARGPSTRPRSAASRRPCRSTGSSRASAAFAAGRPVDRLGGGALGWRGRASPRPPGWRMLAAGLDALDGAERPRRRRRAGPGRPHRRRPTAESRRRTGGARPRDPAAVDRWPSMSRRAGRSSSTRGRPASGSPARRRPDAGPGSPIVVEPRRSRPAERRGPTRTRGPAVLAAPTAHRGRPPDRPVGRHPARGRGRRLAGRGRGRAGAPGRPSRAGPARPRRGGRAAGRPRSVPSSRASWSPCRSSPGDAVDAGQQLLVVEAMKMQNELRAPRDGTSAGSRSVPGRTVEVGDLLLVIE